jgi:hypothetical protein
MGIDYSRQLYFSSERGDVDEMAKCVAKGGIIDWRNSSKRDQTALIAASKKNQARAVRFLLSHGARDFKSTTGESALIGAAKHGSDECLYELLMRGSDHHWRSNDGKSPYDWAVSRGIVSSVRLIEACTCPFLSEMDFEVVPNALLSLFVSAKFEPRWVVIERARPTDNPAVSRGNCNMYFYESKASPRWFLQLVRPAISPIRNDPDDKVVFGFTFAGGRWFNGSNIPPRKEDITCRLSRENYRWLRNVLSNGFGAGGGESFDEYRRVRMPYTARTYIEGILGAFDSRAVSLVAPMLGPTDVPNNQNSVVNTQTVPIMTSIPQPIAAGVALVNNTSIQQQYQQQQQQQQQQHQQLPSPGQSSISSESIQLSPFVASLVKDLETNKLFFNSEIPEEFLCPITTEIMVFPVVASDGHTYSHNGIAEWMRHKQSSPQTGQMMDARLLPNHHLRSNVLDWIDKHRITDEKNTSASISSTNVIPVPIATSSVSPTLSQRLRIDISQQESQNPFSTSQQNYSTSRVITSLEPLTNHLYPLLSSSNSAITSNTNVTSSISSTILPAQGAPVHPGEFRLQSRNVSNLATSSSSTLPVIIQTISQQQQQQSNIVTQSHEEEYDDPTSVTPVPSNSDEIIAFPSVPTHVPFRAAAEEEASSYEPTRV